MRKIFVALALGLMSAIAVSAQQTNRQVTAQLPAITPSVTLTLDGKTQQVKPTKAQLMEVDADHVRCTVFAGKDKASVKLPISYEKVLTISANLAPTLCNLGLITAEERDAIVKYCTDNAGAGSN